MGFTHANAMKFHGKFHGKYHGQFTVVLIQYEEIYLAHVQFSIRS